MKQRRWLDDPHNVKRLWRLFLVVLALVVLIEPFVRMHPHFAVEGLFGFHAWFGLLTCVAMILGAKALGALLKRPDTYYDEGAVDDE
jgi:hypothetical protein